MNIENTPFVGGPNDGKKTTATKLILDVPNGPETNRMTRYFFVEGSYRVFSEVSRSAADMTALTARNIAWFVARGIVPPAA